MESTAALRHVYMAASLVVWMHQLVHLLALQSPLPLPLHGPLCVPSSPRTQDQRQKQWSILEDLLCIDGVVCSLKTRYWYPILV